MVIVIDDDIFFTHMGWNCVQIIVVANRIKLFFSLFFLFFYVCINYDLWWHTFPIVFIFKAVDLIAKTEKEEIVYNQWLSLNTEPKREKKTLGDMKIYSNKNSFERVCIPKKHSKVRERERVEKCK